MKKILLLCFMVFSLFCTKAYATEIDLTKDGQLQTYVSNIGFKILNANRIDKRMVFYFKPYSRIVNAGTYSRDRRIELDRGLSNYLESDDEYAAILSHEISHAVDSYNGIFRGYYTPLTYTLSAKKYETNADKRAVDYMVKAGYNPLALIVVLNKIGPQERFDWCSSHPLTSRRLMVIYEYIYNKYPEYLANNAYINNVYYQNFLLTSRENRIKLQNKIEHPQTIKNVHYL